MGHGDVTYNRAQRSFDLSISNEQVMPQFKVSHHL